MPRRGRIARIVFARIGVSETARYQVRRSQFLERAGFGHFRKIAQPHESSSGMA